jgi:hypothetical protein
MYYIYHIPGVKIGCSVNPESRVAKQGYFEFEILEEVNNIYEASYREIQLQREYNYTVDSCLYYVSIANRHKGFKDPSNSGKLGYVAADLKKYHKQNGTKLGEWVKENAKEHNKKISDIMMAKGNHPSQRIVICDKCGKKTKGSGPAARHYKLCQNQNILDIVEVKLKEL